MYNYQKLAISVFFIFMFVFSSFAQNDLNDKKKIQENSDTDQTIQSRYLKSIRSLKIDTVYKSDINHKNPTTKKINWDHEKTKNDYSIKTPQPTLGSGWRKQISDFGWGFALSYRYQWYDNEVMNYFKKASMFSMDLDIFIRKWTITGNAAYGGGRLYDSLQALDFDWQPQTKLATSTYGIFVGYAVKDDEILKISPFAGFQLMKIKLKPDYYMVSPVGLNNTISAPWSPSIGVNIEVKDNHLSDRGRYFIGFGLRFGYSYTILNFTEMNGYIHQFTLGLDWCFRKIIRKKL